LNSLVNLFGPAGARQQSDKGQARPGSRIRYAEGQLRESLRTGRIRLDLHIAVLLVLDDKQAPEPLPLARVSRLNWVIGRAPDCDVWLSDTTVSGSHARIQRSLRHWSIEDLDSTNGTRLNGRRISKRLRLESGDILSLGAVRLFFKPLLNS
jgi:pSer/pThr/pTyr-binding forkhead associated (FHA) protein